jgi:hypothetical protein
MKPLTIIIFGFLLSSRILTEFFSFLSPLGNPSYLLLGMFSIYLSIKAKISMFLVLFAYDISIVFRNIGFQETIFYSFIKSNELMGFNSPVTFLSYTGALIFVIFINALISVMFGNKIRKKHIIGL